MPIIGRLQGSVPRYSNSDHVESLRKAVLAGYRKAGVDLTNTSPERPWIKDGDEYLTELYYQGHTVYEVSREIKRTPANIEERRKHLGLKAEDFGKQASGKKPKTFTDKDFIREGYSHPFKIKVIWDDATVLRAYKMKQNGLSWKAISRELGCAHNTVIHHVRKKFDI